LSGYTGKAALRSEDLIAIHPASPIVDDLPSSVRDEGDRLSTVLPAEPQSAARARSLVMVACRRWSSTEISADAELVVTELVANAVRHTGTEITVRLASLAGSGGLRVEVSDKSVRPIRPRHARALDESGRGLFLVDVLSHQWGADATPTGKTVWAEIVPD
jgi:anti-sigma regulatory factor (Ser/Thr protein kinase)